MLFYASNCLFSVSNTFVQLKCVNIFMTPQCYTSIAVIAVSDNPRLKRTYCKSLKITTQRARKFPEIKYIIPPLQLPKEEFKNFFCIEF